MPIDSSAFGRDMNGIIADQPISCAFGAVTFSATMGETRRSNDVQDIGTLNEADLEIMTTIGSFGSAAAMPNVQQVITVDGTKYHITDRVVEPFGVVVHFILRRV
jgi:hypothetical protein